MRPARSSHTPTRPGPARARRGRTARRGPRDHLHFANRRAPPARPARLGETPPPAMASHPRLELHLRRRRSPDDSLPLPRSAEVDVRRRPALPDSAVAVFDPAFQSSTFSTTRCTSRPAPVITTRRRALLTLLAARRRRPSGHQLRRGRRPRLPRRRPRAAHRRLEQPLRRHRRARGVRGRHRADPADRARPGTARGPAAAVDPPLSRQSSRSSAPAPRSARRSPRSARSCRSRSPLAEDRRVASWPPGQYHPPRCRSACWSSRGSTRRSSKAGGPRCPQAERGAGR